MILVDRENELATLKGLCASFSGGSVVVISGGIASGKTALLRTVGEWAAESGGLTLSAVASRSERDLPLGVLEQLFRSPGLPCGSVERAMKWLDAGALNAWAREPVPGEDAVQVPTRLLRGMLEIIRDLLEDRPVVLCIDDAHHADVPSLQCLLYLVRRLRGACLHVIFGECSHSEGASALMRSEFLREPLFQRIRLEPLSRAGVAEMAAAHLDARPSHDLVTELYEASAGYPMLAQAFLDDCHDGSFRWSGARAGEAFKRSVLDFLYRHDSPVVEVARAIAVLHKPVSPLLLAGVLDIGVDACRQVVHLLTTAQVLVDGRFRHEAFRAAVLEGTPSSTRRAAHARIADLLHNEGFPAVEVAAHIVAAGRLEAPWVVPILQEAAEHALADDDVTTCIRYLRAAYQVCDERQRAAVVSMLVDAEWRLDPASVLRRLHEFCIVGDADPGGGYGNFIPAGYLLWHGRVREAMAILDLLASGDGAAESEKASPVGLDVPGLWGAYLYPALFKRPQPVASRRHDPMQVLVNPELQGVDVIAAELVHGKQASVLSAAEGMLQRSRLSARMLAPLTAALAAFTYNDRLVEAAEWCDELLAEAAERRSPTWHALFAAERAMIHVRRGELQAAEDQAKSALSLISPQSWGVMVGLPLAAAVLALTGRGDLDEALTYLNVPVPEAMFQTRMGLHYLCARGRYHLATNRSHAALSDFLACGRLMGDWGIDLPVVEAWRSGAVEAHLQLGDLSEARLLGDEQLALVDPRHRRTRGMAVRAHAATRDLAARIAVLEEAVGLLQDGGDKLELAHALADLGRACLLLGDPKRARKHGRKALALARQCGAKAPDQGGGFDAALAGPDGAAAHADTGLSDAERRVAALAAVGYTNREIAEKLFITISTVEQHLTRIYRKLNVTRFDLRDALQDNGADLTDPEWLRSLEKCS
ncbi:AAA family ATPase [Actinomadura sp. LOL_016]|uniref:ATP-binding protein n=1 Tax=unclassified Actinomadura TaxID=2626254 RepID=UPI003A7FD0EA